MSLTADLLRACLEPRHEMEGIAAVIETLDGQGLVKWQEPLEAGRPLLHCLLYSGYSQNQFVQRTLRRKPELLTTQDQQGVSLWQAAWDLVLTPPPGHNASSARNSLIMFIGMAPERLFGETPTARADLLQRALKVDETHLTQALEKRLNHVDLTPEATQALFTRLTSGNWPSALRMAGGIEAPVKGPEGVARPLWRLALNHQLTHQMKTALHDPACSIPLMSEPMAWVALAEQLLHNVTTISTVSAADSLLKAHGCPEGLATVDDLGRPAAWYLLMRSPHLMKEMERTQAGRQGLRAQDHAGHTVGFYVFPHLGTDELNRQDFRYADEHQLRHVFTIPVEGRGLVAQHYADPVAGVYRAWGGSKLPNLKVLGEGVGQGHRFMTQVFSSAGVWAMREGDAERIVASWLTSPVVLPELVGFLNHLLDNADTRGCLLATDLEPYVPVLRAFSGLYAGTARADKTNLPQGLSGGRSWTGAMAAEWPTLPVREEALRAMLQQAKDRLPQTDPTVEKNLVALADYENTFFAKLRQNQALQVTAPTQPHRRRLRH